jgi:hypothetical protein
MIYPVPVQEQAGKHAGGMPDIPLVAFSVGNDGATAGLPPQLADAFRMSMQKNGILFSGSNGSLALAWGTPANVAVSIRGLTERKHGRESVQVFGCRASEMPSTVPPDFDFHPLGIAFRMDGQTHRIAGAAGVVSLKSLCRRLRENGMDAHDFGTNVKKLMMKNLSGAMSYLAYRRAEEEMTST